MGNVDKIVEIAKAKIEVLQEVMEEIEKHKDFDLIKAVVQGKIEGNQNFIKWYEDLERKQTND